ncbi:MAG: ATP-dependent Clp protease proteolytic subunit [Candidatus Melainabacteria bacterium]|nr:ATP-dependent Clp protease proteolytic subunit [Candidatus Melainabacteria bacterium]
MKLQQLEAQVSIARLDLEKKERDAALARSTEAENLTFTFYDEVTDESIRPALENLGNLGRRFPGRPITVILNSPGGSVLAGLALYDYLQQLRAQGHHLTVMCFGMAASMGGILLQAGDRRIIGVNARVLIHAVSAGSIGSVYAMEDKAAFCRGLWESLKKILAARSSLSEEQIEERAHRRDWWLEAEEAVSLGFADEILQAPDFSGTCP